MVKGLVKGADETECSCLQNLCFHAALRAEVRCRGANVNL